MRLTVHSDYALRVLIYCAGRSEALVTIATIAKAYDISRAHLMKIAHKLVQGGFLNSVRGRNGGLKLALPATKINVGKVVRLMEGKAPLVECFDRATNTCLIAPACSLKHLLGGAEEAFYRQLETATLADIMLTPKAVIQLFGQTNGVPVNVKKKGRDNRSP